MSFIWKSSIILYAVKALILIWLPFAGEGRDILGKVIIFWGIGYLSSIIFIPMILLVIVLTIVYKSSKIGYYYYFYDDHKQRKASLIMIACIISETTAILLNLKHYSDIGYYIFFTNIIAVLFILTVGFSYILCKNDYMKKVEKQRLIEVG